MNLKNKLKRSLVYRGYCAVFCIQPCECWRSLWPVDI